MKKIYYLLFFMAVAAFGIVTSYLIQEDEIYSPRGANAYSNEKNHIESEEIAPALEQIYSLKNNQNTGLISIEDVNAAYQQANAVRSADRRLSVPLKWEFQGPDNVGGRTRCFLIDKDNPNVMYMGAVSGGLFKSTTGGGSWTAVNDQEENLNVVSIAQDKQGNIYYGVGEGGFVTNNNSAVKSGTPNFSAAGIYKSDDGGSSFSKIASTSSWANISAMASDKVSGRVYVGFASGLRYSDDQGDTWLPTSGTLGQCRDIEIADDGTVYVHSGISVFKSTDGVSYSLLTLPVSEGYGTGVSRIDVAIAPTDNNWIYAIVANGGGGSVNGGSMNGIYLSKDKGNTWEIIVKGGSPYNDALSQVNTLNGQGNYDLALSVDPEDKEHIYWGGVQLAEYRPNTGPLIMASMIASPSNNRYVHADKHFIKWDMSKTPPTMIVGTDGGAYFSYNKGVNFTPKNLGFGTTQFYGIAANYYGQLIGGTQDNGNLLVTFNGNSANGAGNSLNAVRVLSGDGFQTEISSLNHNYVVAESQYGNLQRSRDGGQTFAHFWDTRIGVQDDEVSDRVTIDATWAPFNTQLAMYENMDDSINRLFYAKYSEIWMVKDPFDFAEFPQWFKVSTAISGNTRVVDMELTKDGGSLFYSTALQTGSNQYQYKLYRIGGFDSAKFDIDIVDKADVPSELSTVQISGNGLPNNRAITSMSSDPNDPNHLIITLGNYGNTAYVYECNDALSANPTFTNITGNLPNMPVYHGVITNLNGKEHFILGTELGVWASDDGGVTWTEENDGMARVPVYHVRAYQWNDWKDPSIFLGTHGRGFFAYNSPRNSTTGITTPDLEKSELEVYPNPAIDYTNIKFTAQQNEEFEVIVYNINGKVVYKQKVMDAQMGINELHISTDQLRAGNYFVKVNSNRSASYGKLVVTK
jgi:photosystem II stability/assembly factor-like uncharacterized protein